MATPLLDDIAAHGNNLPIGAAIASGKSKSRPNKITCTDGFTVSVLAGWGAYCDPRPDSFGVLGNVPDDYPGPYQEVEVGFPSQRPEPWDLWSKRCENPDDPTESVYSYVPVWLVRELLEAHGGEVIVR